MSRKIKSEFSKRKNIKGWRIKVIVYNNNPQLCDGKKQLVKNLFISIQECPTKNDAESLALKLEKELINKVKNNGLLTLRHCIDILIKFSKNKSECRKAEYIKKQIGDLLIDDTFKNLVLDWAECQRYRKKLKRKKGYLNDCVETNIIISESTVRGYLRIIKTAINKAIANFPSRITVNPLSKMRIGRNQARKREISDEERKVFEEVIKEYFPWFLFPWLFSTMNMVRPQDQFRLSLSRHVKYEKQLDTWTIEYQPLKTIDQVLEPVFARPVVFDELKPFFQNLHTPEQCDNLFVRPAMKPGEDANKIYPITQEYADATWEKIRKLAVKRLPSTADITYYDWRHFATGYLLQHGMTEVQIVDIAGWTTSEMIWRYYPRNRRLFISTIERMRRSKNEQNKIPPLAA